MYAERLLSSRVNNSKIENHKIPFGNDLHTHTHTHTILYTLYNLDQYKCIILLKYGDAWCTRQSVVVC